jgi:hypothetical protein
MASRGSDSEYQTFAELSEPGLKAWLAVPGCQTFKNTWEKLLLPA